MSARTERRQMADGIHLGRRFAGVRQGLEEVVERSEGPPRTGWPSGLASSRLIMNPCGSKGITSPCSRETATSPRRSNGRDCGRRRKNGFVMNATLSSGIIALAFFLAASPASAQWTPVPQVPATNGIYSVEANGDTIVAGSDNVVFVSTDDGATWKQSAKVNSETTAIRSVLMHNGRLYAGTYGQGILISEDLGDTWLSFNQGLAGGIANSQAYIADFLIDGDNLYVATFGAGVWIRSLALPGTWVHFGDVFEPNQASTVAAVAAGAPRLLAAAGANGMVFFRDPGQTDWTVSFLDNLGWVAGVAPLGAVWTGHAWVVSANTGVYRSATGAPPWSFTNTGLAPLLAAPLTLRGPTVFATFVGISGSMTEFSDDDGASWEVLDVQPSVITLDLATSGNTLYAGRGDGLWRRSMENVSVPGVPDVERLSFGIAGPQPVREDVVFHFDLPEPGRVLIDVFDVAGRRTSDRLEGNWPAGGHEVQLSARGLPPGVYLARLSTAGRHAIARFVRVR
jgi:hypothetical protein